MYFWIFMIFFRIVDVLLADQVKQRGEDERSQQRPSEVDLLDGIAEEQQLDGGEGHYCTGSWL